MQEDDWSSCIFFATICHFLHRGHRTDGTDAFDTLFIGCEKFPQSDYSGGMVDVGGVV